MSVHFGTRSLSWEAFYSAVKTYKKCFPSAFATDRISTLENLRNSRQEGELYTLTDLISTFRDTYCRLPHDKIYAFIGMATDDSPSLIPAAYNKPLFEVYSDVMHFLSSSTTKRAVNEVELVYMSALIRRLLTRKWRKTVEINQKPGSALRQEEPYTFFENGLCDKDGKENLRA